MHVKTQSGSTTTTFFEYAHRDHLGSIAAVTDDSGSVLDNMAFEPFGARKLKDWVGNISTTELDDLLARSTTHSPKVRGFTGHEHLDRTGFVHMNGRLFDPEIGRFLSPDLLVQFPNNSQSWNRYSYVRNSPVSIDDPTGFLEGEDEVLEEIVATAERQNRGNFHIMGYYFTAMGGSSAGYAGGSGESSTGVGTGSSEAAEDLEEPFDEIVVVAQKRDASWWTQTKAFLKGAFSYPKDVFRTAVTGGSVACDGFSTACAQNVENSRRIGRALYDYNNDPEVAKQVDMANKLATQAVMNDPVIQSQIAGRATVATIVGTGGVIGMGLNAMALTGGALRASEAGGIFVDTAKLVQGALGIDLE